MLNQVQMSQRDHVGRSDLDFFNAEIARRPILKAEEELELSLRWKQHRDKAALNQLIGANLRFIIQIVARYSPTGIRLEDLTQEAVIGFMRGIEKWDPKREIRLLTYCVWWIRAYVQLYVVRNWSMVPLSGPHKRIFFSLVKTVNKWRQLNPNVDREPTAEDLAPMLNAKVTEIDFMMRRIGRDQSLQMPHSMTPEDGGSEDTLQDHICCSKPTQDVRLEAEDEARHAKTKIRQALWYLDQRERLVIRRRFLEGEPRAFETIAAELGVSRERVRQIQVKALRKIAQQLGSKLSATEIGHALHEYFPVKRKR